MKGTVIGEYMDLKHARDMDNRTDVLYYIADIIESQGVDEATAEKIADAFLDDKTRPELLAKLKSIKDIPVEKSESESSMGDAGGAK
jgi:hypothetical protein